MKKTFIIVAVIVSATALTVGIVQAAGSHNVTSQFGPDGDIFQVNGTMKMSSVMIGAQGVGGVTYFNGSIVNDTNESGVDNPVTFGDNMRIDGRLWRGAIAGPGDSQPFIVNDDMEVLGTLTVAGLEGTGIVSSDNIADGVVAAADLADSSVTSAKITDGTIAAGDIAVGAVTQTGEASSGTETQTTLAVADNYDFLTTAVDLTTGDSAVLVMFSGVLANNTDNSSARVFLVVDNEVISHTIRRGTSNSLGEVFTLSFTALVDVDAGDHAFHVGWNTDAGTTASLYNHTLDVVELKK